MTLLKDELEEAKTQALELETAMVEAVKQVKLAYEFCPGSYTYHAMIAINRAARALWLKPEEHGVGSDAL